MNFRQASIISALAILPLSASAFALTPPANLVPLLTVDSDCLSEDGTCIGETMRICAELFGLADDIDLAPADQPFYIIDQTLDLQADVTCKKPAFTADSNAKCSIRFADGTQSALTRPAAVWRHLQLPITAVDDASANRYWVKRYQGKMTVTLRTDEDYEIPVPSYFHSCKVLIPSL